MIKISKLKKQFSID